ncbi:hypothetical protein [Treponema sp.]|uniref:hypothetical protein n=1 Tax=Treponema sp. TaxID=166 RepID=UPI0025CD65E5|nr:hypothetical protein [Treponema sp.]MCR5218430.1 hypothetical protein [Treponema sp.]
MKRFIACLLVLMIIFSGHLFAATSSSSSSSSSKSTTPEPYTKEEFSPVLHDLRRAEIITFGSLPFVTLGVTVAYGAYGYFSGDFSSFPNPLDKSADSFSSWQQAKIFGYSLSISVGLGLLDYGINLVKRHKKAKKEKARLEASRQIHVIPYSEEFIREGGLNQYQEDADQDLTAGDGE